MCVPARNNSFIYLKRSCPPVKFARGTSIWPLAAAILLSAGSALALHEKAFSLYNTAIWPILAATMLFCASYLLFFRDPERRICRETACSPADGIVQFVKEEGRGWHIAIFMNIHNVHVNRCPASGKITEVTHIPGSHIPAFEKESERNERVIYTIETEHGPIRMVQIAGIVARRIVPYVSGGEVLEKGDRIGLIRFGSRVDTYLPPSLAPVVKEGDVVRAGESPLAHLRGEADE